MFSPEIKLLCYISECDNTLCLLNNSFRVYIRVPNGAASERVQLIISNCGELLCFIYYLIGSALDGFDR